MNKLLLALTLLASISSFAGSNSMVEINIDSSYITSRLLAYKTEHFADKHIEQAKVSTFKYIRSYMEDELRCDSVLPIVSDLKLVKLKANCPTTFSIEGSLKMSSWNHRTGHLTGDIFDLEQSHQEPVLKIDEKY